MKVINSIPKIEKVLRQELDADRYRHTLGVMYTAAALAMAYGADLEKVQMAGLLHDCAKCIPNDKKLKLCQKYNIPMSSLEEGTPFLLHAKLGAYLAKAKYGVEDEEVLSAITWHTTGKPAMTMIEKIIFLADYIEPMRSKAPNLDDIRIVAFDNIDLAVYLTLRDTLMYLNKKEHDSVDSTTRHAFEYYCQRLEDMEMDEDEQRLVLQNAGTGQQKEENV